MSDIAVMYHYIREQNGWDGIHPLHPNAFEEQLECLAKEYDLVDVNDLDKPSKRPKCVLTFDDGTRDQYLIAYPILRRKGIPAYFSVMSGPILTNQIPIVHLNHAVLSFCSDEYIWDELTRNFDTLGADHRAEASGLYHYEPSPLRRYIKHFLNFELSQSEARMFLEAEFTAIFPDRVDFIENFYLRIADIEEMKNSGYTIGVHCHNHVPFERDAESYFSAEIQPCITLLDSVGINPQWYTAPFGGGSQSSVMRRELEPLLKRHGFRGSFTTSRGTIQGLEDFWLNRIDCINLPPLH